VLADDRDQVLDGVIQYGDELVIVIESKLDGPVETTQHERINLYGQPVVFPQRAAHVSWRDTIGTFTDLLARDLVAGGEREVLSDFLKLVETHFPASVRSRRCCAATGSPIACAAGLRG
jgi:hypothetical protein